MPSSEPAVDPLGEIEALMRELASLETQLSSKKVSQAQYEAAAKQLTERITNAESVAYAMARTNDPIAKKLRVRSFNDPIVQQVSNHFLHGSKKPLEPEFGADRVPRYHVEGDGGRNAVESVVLERMADISILKSSLFEKMLLCPKCGTQSNVFARFKCTNCASIDVAINRMIEHLACGTIHNEKAFQLGKEMVCPTCKKKLQRPEEQRLIGLVCTCNKCGAHFEDPSQSFFCRKCQFDFNLTTGVISDICVYDINEKILGEIRSQLGLPAIAKMLEDNGFRLDIPGTIAGKGKEVQFSIVARKQSIVAAIDIAMSESEVAVEPILELYVKLLEAKPDVSVFGAMPRLSDQARDVASVHGISVAEGTTPDVLGRNILGIVGGDVLSQRVRK
jgi:transposase-like protein